MSYDLHLYLKNAPHLTPERFSEVCKGFGLTVECGPDFSLDGSVSMLSAKVGGLLTEDTRSYLAAVELFVTITDEPVSIERTAPRKKWWQLKKPKGEEVIFPAGSSNLFFSCGIDTLEIPFALLIAYAVADGDDLLDDPQSGVCLVGQEAIAAEISRLLEEIRSAPEDRLYLHEFDQWI